MGGCLTEESVFAVRSGLLRNLKTWPIGALCAA